MAGEKESSNEWQLNKGKLKTGALVRLPGTTEPFGTVVHVTESEALVKRYDTGKREPISLRAEVEFMLPEKTAKETETEASEPSKPTKPKKPKAATDEKPSKPKREKSTKPKPEPEEEIDNDIHTEQEPELSEKKTSKPAKEKKEPTAKSKKETTATTPLPKLDWYSAEELSTATGHNPAWIGKNREELFESSMYKTDTEAEGRGRKPIVYNQEALEVLKNTPVPTRGGGRRKTSDNADAPLASMDVRPPKVKASASPSALSSEGAPRGRKKSSAAPVSDPASDALDAIEATIAATERQRDAHAERYESLLSRLRQQKSELEFLASGLAG